MRMSAAPASSLTARMRPRIWAWIVTSSAVVGSSAISRAGSQAIAMAIIARWRIPPESSWGCWRIRRSGEGMPTRRSISSARARPCAREAPRCRRGPSAICSPMRSAGLSEVMGSWNTIAIRSPRRSEAPSMSRPSNRAAPPERRSGGVGSRPISASAVRLLPQPDSPTIASVSARPARSASVRRRATSSRVARRAQSAARAGSRASRASIAASGVSRAASSAAKRPAGSGGWPMKVPFP